MLLDGVRGAAPLCLQRRIGAAFRDGAVAGDGAAVGYMEELGAERGAETAGDAVVVDEECHGLFLLCKDGESIAPESCKCCRIPAYFQSARHCGGEAHGEPNNASI